MRVTNTIRNIELNNQEKKDIEKAILEIQKILVKDIFIPIDSAKEINQNLMTIKDKLLK